MQRKGRWSREWWGSGRPYPAFRISTPGSVTRRGCSPHDGFPLFSSGVTVESVSGTTLYFPTPPQAPHSPPEFCAYIANKVIDVMEDFTCSRDRVTIKLLDDWTVTAAYSDPRSSIGLFLLRPISRKTIILGDFNAKHASWFDCNCSDDHHSLSRGRALFDWSRRAHTVERGSRLPTRHRAGDSPSKIDLIRTRRDAEPLTIGDYAPLASSHHCILSARFRFIRPPTAQIHPRPDYKRMSQDQMKLFFESHPIPTNPTQLDDILQNALNQIPCISRQTKNRLPPDIRHARSHL